MKTHLSLFSGIGGLDIAAEMAGFATVGQCEWAGYPTKVLEKHWPDVPRWRDIRTLTKENFNARTGLGTVDVVSGGFPCQPFSQAGKRRGKEDDRYLWPEMLRVIREIRPAWVVGENVAGIVNMALDTVLFDLENEGYTVQAFIIPAASVDAPHKRDRAAIVAHANSERQQRCEQHGTPDQKWKAEPHRPTCQPSEDVSDPDDGRGAVWWNRELQPTESAGSGWTNLGGRTPEHGKRGGRTTKPGLGGMAYGLSGWLDRGMSAPGEWLPDPAPDIPRIATDVKDRANRLKCLGNAVVPQQFYPIFAAIMEVDSHEELG